MEHVAYFQLLKYRNQVEAFVCSFRHEAGMEHVVDLPWLRYTCMNQAGVVACNSFLHKLGGYTMHIGTSC